MSDAEKKGGPFAKIASGQQALKTVKDASRAFFVLAAMQAVIGALMFPGAIIDAIIVTILAGALAKWRSRTAAVLLLVVAGLQGVVTVLNKLGVAKQGGSNIILAAIMIVAAVRAVEATFKLHGRYRQELARAA